MQIAIVGIYMYTYIYIYAANVWCIVMLSNLNGAQHTSQDEPSGRGQEPVSRIPKLDPTEAYFKACWTFFWDGNGVEGCTLEFHGLWSLHSTLGLIQLSSCLLSYEDSKPLTSGSH